MNSPHIYIFCNGDLGHFGNWVSRTWWETKTWHDSSIIKLSCTEWWLSVDVMRQRCRWMLLHQADNITIKRIDIFITIMFSLNLETASSVEWKFKGSIKEKEQGGGSNKRDGKMKNWKRFGRGRQDMLCVDWLRANQALLIWTHREVFTLEETGNDEDSPRGCCSLSHEGRASHCCFWTNLATALCPFQHALSCLGLNGWNGSVLIYCSLSPCLRHRSVALFALQQLLINVSCCLDHLKADLWFPHGRSWT